jgi:hypothetical protein
VSPRPVAGLDALRDTLAALDDWPARGACAGSGVEFIDVSEDQARDLVRGWCLRCPVAGPCHDLGLDLAPHSHSAVFGGRYFDRRATTSRPVLATRRTA